MNPIPVPCFDVTIAIDGEAGRVVAGRERIPVENVLRAFRLADTAAPVVYRVGRARVEVRYMLGGPDAR